MVSKRKNQWRKNLFYAFMLLVVFVVGLTMNFRFFGNEPSQVEKEIMNIVRYETSNLNGDSVVSQIGIPAVDSNGNGVITNLVVEATPGSGKTLVDIDSLLFIADTQNSIRTAKEVAMMTTGKDLGKYDLIYHIDANASIIGGPSAGAALTIATIASINNQKLSTDVMITGGINHDGTISPVGGVLDKAKAAKDAGYNLFLVPLDQKEEVVYRNSEYCRKIGFKEFCAIEQIPEVISVGDQAGISVVEVLNISDAYHYFVTK